MDTKINYTAVGFIVVALIALLTGFLLWWTTDFRHKNYHTYVVYMNQDVSGLSVQSPVKFNGVLVGKVASIQLNNQDPQQVILQLNIQVGTPITTSTVATLANQGLTGVSFIDLSATTSDTTPLVAAPGQVYPMIPSQPSLMSQILSEVKEAAGDFKQVSASLKQIFNQQNTQNIQDILQNLAKTSKAMPAMVSQVNQSAQDVGVLTNNINQAVPSALQLLDRLNQMSGNLDVVTSEMKQNPAVLVRGTTGPTLGPGEQ